MDGTLRIVVDGDTYIDVEDVSRGQADRLVSRLSKRRGFAYIEHPNGQVSVIARKRFIAAEYQLKDESED